MVSIEQSDDVETKVSLKPHNVGTGTVENLSRPPVMRVREGLLTVKPSSGEEQLLTLIQLGSVKNSLSASSESRT